MSYLNQYNNFIVTLSSGEQLIIRPDDRVEYLNSIYVSIFDLPKQVINELHDNIVVIHDNIQITNNIVVENYVSLTTMHPNLIKDIQTGVFKDKRILIEIDGNIYYCLDYDHL